MIARDYNDITPRSIDILDPWPITFDETLGVWSISGNDQRANVPLATIRCQFDGHNSWRRRAGHLITHAEKMYYYLVLMSGRGDELARSLIDSIQIEMITNDAEERVMQSKLFNPRRS